MKPLNIENQDFPLCLNSDRWTSQDNGDYLITSNNEKHLLPTYEYCENLSNQWRTDTPCSLSKLILNRKSNLSFFDRLHQKFSLETNSIKIGTLQSSKGTDTISELRI